MAVLTDQERDEAVAGYVEDYHVKQHFLAKYGVDELRGVVDALDDWYDDNLPAINQALPVNFRNTATLKEKALIFAAVALARGRV